MNTPMHSEDHSDTLATVLAALKRIEHLLNEQQHEWIDIEQAARLTSLSTSHIRRAISSRELAAANAGKAGRPTWRIAKKDLRAWMESKKGGPTVPCKSQLKELVNRHLPGL